MKNKYKLYFLILLAVMQFFAYTSIYAQSTDVYDYRKSGVSAQIEKYLCAPTNQSSSYLSNQYTDAGVANTAARNLASNDLYICINRIYRFAIILASVVAVFFIVIGGYVYMSAEGNQESVDKAKSILVSSVTALVILMGGYVLLKALNPDLIKFKQIQPTSVKPLDTTGWDQWPKVTFNADGSIKSITGGAGHKAQELIDVGCVFQTSKQQTEVPNMSEPLFKKIKDLCYNTKNDLKSTYPNISPKISSVIGEGLHSQDSYHYKGCAIDFADGRNDFTTTEPGITIKKEAEKLGFRINPGTDATKTNHIHVDIGSQCPVQ